MLDPTVVGGAIVLLGLGAIGGGRLVFQAMSRRGDIVKEQLRETQRVLDDAEREIEDLRARLEVVDEEGEGEVADRELRSLMSSIGLPYEDRSPAECASAIRGKVMELAVAVKRGEWSAATGKAQAELALRVRSLEAREAALKALVRRAARESVITTSDNPGCFYCDHEEHTRACPARGLLGTEVVPAEGETAEAGARHLYRRMTADGRHLYRRMTVEKDPPGPRLHYHDAFPWCSECETPCHRVDEDGCCTSCGTDVLYDEEGHPLWHASAAAEGNSKVLGALKNEVLTLQGRVSALEAWIVLRSAGDGDFGLFSGAMLGEARRVAPMLVPDLEERARTFQRVMVAAGRKGEDAIPPEILEEIRRKGGARTEGESADG